MPVQCVAHHGSISAILPICCVTGYVCGKEFETERERMRLGVEQDVRRVGTGGSEGGRERRRDGGREGRRDGGMEGTGGREGWREQEGGREGGREEREG